MKKMIISLTFTAVFLVACGTTPTPLGEKVATVTTEIEEVLVEETLQPDEVGNIEALLSPDEIAGLLYIQEEEKLTRDIYLTLHEQWGTKIFQNIADNKVTQMDAIKILIDQYGLEDPTIGKEIGEFSNIKFQELYDQLIVQGHLSRNEAFKVSLFIEEMSILDLEEYLLQTDDLDIQKVYGLLLKGSHNYLRSFVKIFEQQSGEVYQPQYLSWEDYDTIMNAETEPNGQGQGNGQGSATSTP